MSISTALKNPPMPDLEMLVQQQTATLRQEMEQRFNAIEARLPHNKVSIVMFSDDMDKVLAAFTLANGAAAMDMEVTMYFTFWGVAAVKKSTQMQGKNFKQRMLALMTPGRSESMGISKMNMGGMGAWMMRNMMKEKQVASLEELRDIAIEMGVHMIGCSKAMDMMGISFDELIDGIQAGSVTTFMEDALKARMTVFL